MTRTNDTGPRRSAPAQWDVITLGRGTHVFRWFPDRYLSVFTVSSDGVLAVDPVRPAVAQAFREAIASVCSAPVTTIVYSHDHRDHIGGAPALGADPGHRIYAYKDVPDVLSRRADPDVSMPTDSVIDEVRFGHGADAVELRYLGPNHSRTNLAMWFPTDSGRMLLLSDVLEPGIVPYREMPDTDVQGLCDTLELLRHTDQSLVIGGHRGPAPAEWIATLAAYLGDLITSARRRWTERPPTVLTPGSSGFEAAEAERRAVMLRVADDLRPTWHARVDAFDVWAPANADRIISWLLTGQ